MKTKKTALFFFTLALFAIGCSKVNSYEGNWAIKNIVVDTNLIPEKIDANSALGLFFLDEMYKPTNIVISKELIQLKENDNILENSQIQEITEIKNNKFKIVFDNNSGIFELNETNSAYFTVSAVKYVLEKTK